MQRTGTTCQRALAIGHINAQAEVFLHSRSMGLHLFAGLRVTDYEAARPWYERLFGEPSFFPNDTEAVWTLGDDRSVYIVEHAEGAGNSVVTLFLDDLDGFVAGVSARGLEPDERLTYSNGVRKAHYHDPDGNEIALGGPPLDSE
jgi:predicted enzyme related to lactoylglutathione lyase